MAYTIEIIDQAGISRIKDTWFDNLGEFQLKPVVLSEVVRSELMNFRTSPAHTKTRAEVSGGGKKPWRQKGTGRARHGSIRSPIWVGGGVAFGPRNTTNWHLKINKTARTAALRTIFKERLEDNCVYLLNDNFDFPKTKDAIPLLNVLKEKSLEKKGKLGLVYTTDEKSRLNGFANLGVNFINAKNLKITQLVNCPYLVLTPSARTIIEERLK